MKFFGNGSTLTSLLGGTGTSAVPHGEITTITVGGESVEAYSDTYIDNTGYTTFVGGVLKTVNPFTMSISYDKSQALPAVGENAKWTLKLGNSGKKVEFYAFVKEKGDMEVTAAGELVVPVTLQPSNRDFSGVETGPAVSAAL